MIQAHADHSPRHSFYEHDNQEFQVKLKHFCDKSVYLMGCLIH